MAEIQRLISDPAFRAAAARDPRSLQEHRDIGTLLGLLRERTEERDALRGMVRKLAGYLESANELLRQSGLVERGVLGLRNEDPETVQAAMKTLRARLLGIKDASLAASDSNIALAVEAAEAFEEEDQTGNLHTGDLPP
jgi:hypothetical protein